VSPTTDELRLADRIAIHELRAGYTHHYDAGDLERFVALFTEDGLLQLANAGWARGHDELRSRLAGPMRAAAFAIHFTTDELTEFTGPDTARGTSRFAVHHGRGPDIEGAGTYHDEYVRTAVGWRIASRRISFFYMGERAVPWAAAPAPAPPEPPPTPAPVPSASAAPDAPAASTGSTASTASTASEEAS
jgi:ketosteroid isomerase-like protein